MIVKASPITRLQFQFTQIPVHTDGVPTALTVIPTATKCSAAPSTCPQSSSHTCDGLGNTAAVQLCMLETIGRWTIKE